MFFYLATFMLAKASNDLILILLVLVVADVIQKFHNLFFNIYLMFFILAYG